ncbi:MAG: di-heme oxidoredictase family protein [Candidatus Competibacterales bacterium]
MGVTNPLFPEESCSPLQITCREQAREEPSARPNATALELALVEFYNRTLAVPRRRDADDPVVLAGKGHFHQTGCVGCHTPRYETGPLVGSALGEINGLFLDPEAEPREIEVLSRQTIWPYTDLLLHDMGGECRAVTEETPGVWVQRCTGLADGRPVFDASGSEWRTPPLWGIGLTQTVNPRAGFLHDGRARTVEEAILWHDGEARAAKEGFMALPRAARAALLRFVESL